MIDGFVSVEFFGSGNFNKIFEFVKGFIDYFDVFEERVYVGLVVFFIDVY